jgi:hypothetical protein
VDLSSVRDAIERYAHAVQQAGVDEVRRHAWRAAPARNAQLILAQLAGDRCQHGSGTISNFRHASFDPEQCMSTATVHFAQAPSLDVRLGLIELQGRWVLIGAHALPGEYQRRHSAVAS